ncbi:glycoside hydrolase family 99-like domain-containing protein [Pseudomonas putida]|nr:glycoside hydrolase family 99-like domain-containing protein [Pseudomonas putida]EKT4515528.1 glycoside hydrolase family 99-like domain-containing protein [Pseudomonas putida]
MDSTSLKKANTAFREQKYAVAIKLYKQALDENPSLRSTIGFNLALAEDRLHAIGNEVRFKPRLIKDDIPRIKFDDAEDKFYPYIKKTKPDSAVKLIAFYLPQFHPFPENDEWWGKGFTEWSNVGKASPNYIGHDHPHCPIHLGYYDLRLAEVQEEQAKLAKEYGIHGFNYYFYWFDGKTLMEAPLKAMLANSNVDMPFCLTWANENWSRRWDGQENDILISQNHSKEDSLNFIRHLAPYFKDPRYIKINNKPVLMIYRPSIIPEMKETAEIWREEVQKMGFPGIYLISAQTFGIKSPEPFGFDASAEFPPHTVESSDIQHEVAITNPEFTGHIFSYDQVVNNAVKSIEPEYKLFRATMLSWDNTARKQNASHIFHGFSLLKYKQWLSSVCSRSANNPKYSSDEKIVFINAWNEWAEGTHLEPDRKYGFGYLETTRSVAYLYDKKSLQLANEQPYIKKHDVAVILHLHYPEVWPELRSHFKKLTKIGFDLYVTVTDPKLIKLVKDDFSYARIKLVENRGRDILPFIETLRAIHGFNYSAICKIHSKRSAYRDDGDQLRNELYESLLGSTASIKKIISQFTDDPLQGLLVPEKYLIKHTPHNMTYDTEIVQSLANIMNIDFKYSTFPAGSMFWFRQASLSRILYLGTSNFDVEEGLADGTNAHGIERMFCLIAEGIGYKVSSIEKTKASRRVGAETSSGVVRRDAKDTK